MVIRVKCLLVVAVTKRDGNDCEAEKKPTEHSGPNITATHSHKLKFIQQASSSYLLVPNSVIKCIRYNTLLKRVSCDEKNARMDDLNLNDGPGGGLGCNGFSSQVRV